MKKYIPYIVLLILSNQSTFGQKLTINADLRCRYEYRHGYSTLFYDSLKAGNFIAQRTRLIFHYSSDRITVRISPQNVRIWGDVATTSARDSANALHEAWAELKANEKLSFRAGRQELNYDDARILGNLDWTMAARSHDLMLLKFHPDSTNMLHAGIAVNGTKETNVKDLYSVSSQYRFMQFLWYHGSFSNTGISALFINQGLPYMDSLHEKTAWTQTSGIRLTHGHSRIKAEAAFYLQTGEIAQNKVNALCLAAGIYYKPSGTFQTGIGFEYLSGKDSDDPGTEIKSFLPWFGTNHKFNGYMDYFYVNNHKNSVGLQDLFMNFTYEKGKIKALFAPHYFLTAADLVKAGKKQDTVLGTELDITLSYQIDPAITLHAGYSHMLATETLEYLKGGDKNTLNNWGFVAIHFSPELLSVNPAQKK